MVSGPRDGRDVCLTFDDGPHPAHTPRVLDALARHGAPATFFLVGARAARHPELVRAIARAGHAIGQHSFWHRDPQRTSAVELADEIERTAALLASLTGDRPALFRPPHGKLTAGKLARVWRARHTAVLWNVDPRDFARPSAADALAFFRAAPPRPGDLVLLHDTHPRAAELVDGLAALILGQGLRFTAVPAWL